MNLRRYCRALRQPLLVQLHHPIRAECCNCTNGIDLATARWNRWPSSDIMRSDREAAMIREILKMGDPRLLRVARPVADIHDPALSPIIADMFETMHAAQGVGLAAPQIGVDLRLMIFGFDANPRYPDAPPVPATTLINPWLEVIGDEVEDGWEGCLSVPGLRGVVPRARHIRYGGFLQDGREFAREASGFHARVFQHEFDHLNGVLYPQRITDMTRFGFIEAFAPGATPGVE